MTDPSTPRLTVVETLYPSNFRDAPATLRTIADQIEAGTYGEVGNVAVCLLGSRLEVFGMGPDSDAGAVVLLLQAGVNKLVRPIEEYGT